MLVHPDRNKIAADVDKFKNAFQRLNEAQNKLSVLADNGTSATSTCKGKGHPFPASDRSHNKPARRLGLSVDTVGDMLVS